MPLTTHFNRAAAARIALACAVVAASLWDFRIGTVRIFDMASLALMCGFFALEFDARRDWVSSRAFILPLVVLIIAYAAIGYVNFHHRSSFAMSLLALVCLQFAGYTDVLWLARVFRWIVYLNVGVLLVQYFSFRIFGWVLDPQVLFGIQSRIFEYPNREPYLRAAGLFQEPNSYGLNMFTMSVAALVPKRDRIFTLAAAGSMLLTESAWAVVAAFVLVALNEWNSSAAFVKKCATTLALWVAIFAVFNGYLWAIKPGNMARPPLYGRVGNLTKDTSVRDRYGALVNMAPLFRCPECRLTSPAFELPKGFGRGLSTNVFYSAVPVNGYSFLWYCMGLAGIFLLLSAVFWSVYRLTLRDKLYVFGAVAFAFSTYPLVTYVIYWIWLPALILMARQRSESFGNGPHARAQ